MTSFAYDAVGNMISLTDPVGNTTNWTRDALNRVTAETNQFGDSRFFAYDPAGNLTQRTDRNGRATQYDYDRLHRRTQERWLDDWVHSSIRASAICTAKIITVKWKNIEKNTGKRRNRNQNDGRQVCRAVGEAGCNE
jgi:YD repeat-containing protein